MIGQGVSSRSSHSDAAGRMTFSANPWAQSRMSFWSWVSSRLKVGFVLVVGTGERWRRSLSAVAASMGNSVSHSVS